MTELEQKREEKIISFRKTIEKQKEKYKQEEIEKERKEKEALILERNRVKDKYFYEKLENIKKEEIEEAYYEDSENYYSLKDIINNLKKINVKDYNSQYDLEEEINNIWLSD